MKTRTVHPAVAFAALLLSPLMYIWYGYVLSVLWAWFVVSTFHVAPLTIPIAIGLSLIVGMFTSSLAKSKDNEDEDGNVRVLTAVVSWFCTPLLFLAIGAVVHSFVAA